MKSLIKDLRHAVAVSCSFVCDHWIAVTIFNLILGTVNYVVLFTNIPEHIAKFIKSLFKKHE